MLPYEDQVLLQDTLVSLSVKDTVIKMIMTMLQDQETELKNDPLPEIQEAWFGGSHTGGHRLAANTMQASTVVETQLQDMLIGLRQYREAIKAYADDALATDENIAVSLTHITKAVACTDGAPVTTCAPPTDNS